MPRKPHRRTRVERSSVATHALHVLGKLKTGEFITMGELRDRLPTGLFGRYATQPNQLLNATLAFLEEHGKIKQGPPRQRANSRRMLRTFALAEGVVPLTKDCYVATTR